MNFSIDKIIEEASEEKVKLKKKKMIRTLVSHSRPKIYKVPFFRALKNKIKNDGFLVVFIHPVLHRVFLIPVLGLVLKRSYQFLRG